MKKILSIVFLLAGVGVANAQTAPVAAPPASPDESVEEPPPPPSTTVTATTTTTAAKPWSFGIAARVGLDVPTAKLGPFAGGTLEIDAATPVADHRLIIALGFGLTQPSHDGTVMDPRVPGGMATYTVKETELAIGVDAVFRIAPPGKKLVPWIGAGPLIHLLKTSETTSIAPGTNTEQSTSVGAEGAAGLDVAAGPGFALVDARYRWSSLDHDLTGKTNAGNVVISVGYRLTF